MFSSMRRGLKSIDFYQAVPSELSQGTVTGACISMTLLTILSTLIIIAIIDHSQPRTGSDLIIDHEHLDQKLKVNIDISFPHYSCSMLSLDIQNILNLHDVNIGENIKKYDLSDGKLYTQSNDVIQKIQRITNDFRTGKGCRMTGWFEIDRVPGNFHFSCHAYGDIMPQFLMSGGYDEAHRNIDLSHIIHYLWFGEKQQSNSATLSDFHSRKEIGDQFLGISYTYFLDIVETNSYRGGETWVDNYQYTVRMNQVILGTFPIILFKYQTNPITVLNYYEIKQWHELFVNLVGLIGGIVTVGIILDAMVHSSVRFLLEKHRLNKLR